MLDICLVVLSELLGHLGQINALSALIFANAANHDAVPVHLHLLRLVDGLQRREYGYLEMNPRQFIRGQG